MIWIWVVDNACSSNWMPGHTGARYLWTTVPSGTQVRKLCAFRWKRCIGWRLTRLPGADRPRSTIFSYGILLLYAH